MGHHHSAPTELVGPIHTPGTVEVASSPVVTANVAATQSVVDAAGANSPAAMAQQAAATAVINATGDAQHTATTTVSDCCAPHVNLALSGVTSQQAHSYLMNLYENNTCDHSYLEELYNKCNHTHTKATAEPSYLNELYVEDCHAQHISDKCTTTPTAPVKTTDGDCLAAKSVCTATGESNPACIAAKAQCPSSSQTATPVHTETTDLCPAAKSVCTAVGMTNPSCVAAKAQCGATSGQSYLEELYVKKGHKADNCLAAKSVCTATGSSNPACIAAKAQCAKQEGKQVVVVKDSASKCPAAVSVCTATGDDSAECTAAKEQCVGDL